MENTNASFTGLAFYVGKLGDQTVVSQSFWGPLALPSLNLAGNPWNDEVTSLLSPDVFGTTGPEFPSPAANVGALASWFLGGTPSPLDELLQGEPEAVICFLGSADILGTDASGIIRPGFESDLNGIVLQILSSNSIPILVTIHPQLGRESLVMQLNAIICNTAESHGVPIVDFHAEVLSRQPTNWYGSLVSNDGVNLSNATGTPGDFGPANLAQNGYALLNFSCLRVYSEIYQQVLTSATAAAPLDFPRGALLGKAHPNPFNPTTTVPFELPTGSHVELDVFDISGRFVRALHHGHLGAGAFRAVWDGTDQRGRRVAGGAYVLRLRSSHGVRSTRVSLVK